MDITQHKTRLADALLTKNDDFAVYLALLCLLLCAPPLLLLLLLLLMTQMRAVLPSGNHLRQTPTGESKSRKTTVARCKRRESEHRLRPSLERRYRLTNNETYTFSGVAASKSVPMGKRTRWHKSHCMKRDGLPDLSIHLSYQVRSSFNSTTSPPGRELLTRKAGVDKACPIGSSGNRHVLASLYRHITPRYWKDRQGRHLQPCWRFYLGKICRI